MIDRALELVDSGEVGTFTMLVACLKFMGDRDVAYMLDLNGMNRYWDEPDCDPTEADEWQSFDRDC